MLVTGQNPAEVWSHKERITAMDSARHGASETFELPWAVPPEELISLERQRLRRFSEAASKFRRLAGDELNDRVMKKRRLNGVRELREKIAAVDPETLLPRTGTDRKVVLGVFDLLLDKSFSAGLSGAHIKELLNKLLPLGTTSVSEYTTLPEADKSLRRLIFGIESITLADSDISLLEAAFFAEASEEDQEKARVFTETMEENRFARGRERELAEAWKNR